MSNRVVVTLGGLKNASEGLYLEALRQAGLEPEPLYPDMPTDKIASLLKDAAGLVLSGGPDVHPSRYGEEVAGSKVNAASVKRDEAEFAAVSAADEAGLPILAICRGAQVLNVARGGALFQDIGKLHQDGRAQADKWMSWHAVQVDEDTRLKSILPEGYHFANSRHHQAVDPERLGEGLEAVGWCGHDAGVEAIEGPGDRFVVGVQWHPENMAVDAPEGMPEKEQARALFAAFAAAVREFAASK